MANRINRAIELLEADQAIYYDGPHTGHVLTYEQGRTGRQDLGRLHQCRHGARRLRHDRAGGIHARPGRRRPDHSGHRTPTVIVEAPVNGIDGPNVAFNAWQFRQILARGVHGILLCQAESADAVKEFVRACRFPHHKAGTDKLGIGTAAAARSRRRRRSGALISKSISPAASPGRSTRKGELLLGVKIESPAGVANADEILAVPGLGFAELGPGDLGLSLGYTTLQRRPYPPEMEAARARGLRRPARRTSSPSSKAPRRTRSPPASTRACASSPATIPRSAKVGRAHQKRTMPV